MQTSAHRMTWSAAPNSTSGTKPVGQCWFGEVKHAGSGISQGSSRGAPGDAISSMQYFGTTPSVSARHVEWLSLPTAVRPSAKTTLNINAWFFEEKPEIRLMEQHNNTTLAQSNSQFYTSPVQTSAHRMTWSAAPSSTSGTSPSVSAGLGRLNMLAPA